jgi:hypothetical protein
VNEPTGIQPYDHGTVRRARVARIARRPREIVLSDRIVDGDGLTPPRINSSVQACENA